jgi:hypothetical protein
MILLTRFFYCLLFIVLWFSNVVSAQDTIRLVNPSFELTSTQVSNVLPFGWKVIDDNPQYLPDWLSGINKLHPPARDGDRYLTMCVTDSVVKGVVQAFEVGFLRKDQVYCMNAYLATQAKYPNADTTAQFDNPVGLLVVGYNRLTRLVEVLALTPVVENNDWQRYRLFFQPVSDSINEIGFYAYSVDETRNGRGNVMIDRLSPICRQPAEVADTIKLLRGVPIVLPQVSSERIELFNPSFEPLFNSSVQWRIVRFEKDKSTIKPKIKNKFFLDYTPPILFPGSGYYRKAADGHGFGWLFTFKQGFSSGLVQTLYGGATIEQHQCYRFSLSAAFDPLIRRKNQVFKRHKNPLRLRIWGGVPEDPKRELLAQTNTITQSDWKTYEFELVPEQGNWTTITIEGFYVTDQGEPYDGHILVDNCSAIEKIK